MKELQNTAEADTGLSIYHNSPKAYNYRVIRVKTWSNLTEVEELRSHNETRKAPQRYEGDIKGFSSRSRQRLIKKILKANFSESDRPLFITLTYPKTWSSSPQVWKSHIARFTKWLNSDTNISKWIWKLEFQKRGAPHFHLIAKTEVSYKKQSIYLIRARIARKWYEIVGSGDSKHLRAGTNVEEVESSRRVTGYVSKYISKENGVDISGRVGRWWACSSNWEEENIMEFELVGHDAAQFKRFLRRLIKSRWKGSKKYTKYLSKQLNCTAFISGLDALRWYEYTFAGRNKAIFELGFME